MEGHDATEVADMLNTNLQKTYEVEKIIDHYSLVFGKIPTKQYLIR